MPASFWIEPFDHPLGKPYSRPDEGDGIHAKSAMLAIDAGWKLSFFQD